MEPKDHDRNKIADHLANERTYLAWTRTSLGIMAFGFVIERFGLFLKNISVFLNQSPSPQIQGYSSAVGIAIIAIGLLIGILAFFKYKQVEKEIKKDIFTSSNLLTIFLTIAIVFIGLFLIGYLR